MGTITPDLIEDAEEVVSDLMDHMDYNEPPCPDCIKRVQAMAAVIGMIHVSV